MKKKIFCGIVLVAAILLYKGLMMYQAEQALAPGVIKIAVAGEVPSTAQNEAQADVDLFRQVLQDDFAVPFHGTTTLYLCADDKYEEVLEQKMHLKQAEAKWQDKQSGGLSNFDRRLVAVRNQSAITTERIRAITIAHELFHQVQGQLDQGRTNGLMMWMIEGTADFMGVCVAEKAGTLTLDIYKQRQLNVLRNSLHRVDPVELFSPKREVWNKFMEQKKEPYAMADLMVIYLLEHYPKEQSGELIANYFRQAGNLNNGEKAFSQVFGMTKKEFLIGFNSWLEAAIAAPAEIEISAGAGVSSQSADYAERGAFLARQFIRDNLGQDIKSSLKIILCSDEASYVEAMHKNIGVSLDDAKIRAKTETCIFVENTILLNTEKQDSPIQQKFIAAIAFMRCFEDQMLPSSVKEPTAWLIRGSGGVVGAHALSVEGIPFYRNQQYWLECLSRGGKIPALSEMKTGEQWKNASTTYGIDTVSLLSDSAAAYLLQKHGMHSLLVWLEAVRAGDGQEEAFSKAYNMTLDQFYNEFDDYLQQKIGRNG